MATINENILSLLKAFYKDKVENLMFRNSPTLKTLKRERIEGKSYNFSAILGAGGATSANFLTAKAKAANTVKAIEFVVTPGQLFSVYSLNAAEQLASSTKRGAYMKVAGAKMFAATESFRKVLAGALFGSGYGDIGYVPTGQGKTLSTSVPNKMVLTPSTIIKLDIDMDLQFGTTAVPSAALHSGVNTITAISGNEITFTATSADVITVGSVICINGFRDIQGKPLAPAGLAAWLPSIYDRSGANWTAYINVPFFGITRSIATDRLAGVFVKAAASEKKMTTVMTALRMARRQGSLANMIVLNDSDFAAIMVEIQTQSTYMQTINQQGRGNSNEVSMGLAKQKYMFSTSWVEMVYDDPYLEEGTFYILDTEAVELVSFTNTEILADGVAGNDAGSPDPMASNDDGDDTMPTLLIKDYITVSDGDGAQNGQNLNVTLNFFGSIAITNPAHCAVGRFAVA